jgi:hypothetical protein
MMSQLTLSAATGAEVLAEAEGDGLVQAVVVGLADGVAVVVEVAEVVGVAEIVGVTETVGAALEVGVGVVLGGAGRRRPGRTGI